MPRVASRWSRAALLTVVLLVATTAAPGVAEAADPKPWRIMNSPNSGTAHNQTREVSCVNNVRCVAVGYTQDAVSERTRSLAMTLVGGAWKVVPVPMRGGLDNRLWNVSCVSATSCTAVGDYYNVASGYFKTLIARFNGTKWSLVASPNRPNVHNFLFGVDCTSTTHCVAVGRTQAVDPTPQPARSLVLVLTGGQWRMPAVPNRPDASNQPTDVSCADASNCKVSGYSIAADLVHSTLVLSLSNGTWSIDTTVDRPGMSNLLRDVNCPTATTCVAVGASDPAPDEGAHDELSLIQTFSDGTWTLATSPDRPGFDNHLWAVSCSNAANCVAAGQSQNNQLARPLVQTLAAGSWTLTSPSPYRAGTFNYLYGLSCPTFRNCKAAGDYLNVASNRFRTTVMTNSPV